jgi:hypothetical protein
MAFDARFIMFCRKYMFCLSWLKQFLLVAFMAGLTTSRLPGGLCLVLGGILIIPIKRRIR